jgi:CRP/FNR family nitrogen fixation transcriptional regulator
MHTASEIHSTTHLAAVMSGRASYCDNKPFGQCKPKDMGVLRSFERDQEIFGQGDAADFFFKVTCGTVRTYKLLIDGRRQIDAFHLPGDIFGFETGVEHRFAAEAIQDVKVRAFRRRDLSEMLSTDPVAISDLMLAMAAALERAQDHMLLLGRKCAREKIATFLLRISERISNKRTIELSMSRTDIADHLGLTIETVSRTLTQLQRENVIEIPCGRRGIVLRNPSALMQMDSGDANSNETLPVQFYA